MRLRVAILIALTALTLTYRATALYMKYLSPDLQTSSYFSGGYMGGEHVVVRAVRDDAPELEGIPDDRRVQAGDRILEIYDGQGNGGKVEGLFEYGALLRPIGPEPWRMVVERPVKGADGKVERFERVDIAMPPATPVSWSLGEWTASLGMDVFLPFLAMAVGCLVGFLRPRDPLAFLAALVFILFSMWFRQPVSQFPVGLREMGLVLSGLAVCATPYLFMHFFLLFPERSPIDRKAPWLRHVALVVAAFYAVLDLTTQLTLHTSFSAFVKLNGFFDNLGFGSRFFGWSWFAMSGVMIGIGMTSLVWAAFHAESQNDRRRIRWIATGAILGLLPIVALIFSERFGVKVNDGLLTVAILLAAVFPATFAYSVIMHQVFGIRLILRRGLQYTVVSKSFVVLEGGILFAALFFVTRPLMIRMLPEGQTSLAAVGLGLLTIGLVAGTQRLNRAIFPAIDRRFFRDAYDARAILTQLSHAVRRLASRPDLLLARVCEEISAALHPTRVAVFLREDLCPRVGELPQRDHDAVRWTGDIDANQIPRTLVCCLSRTAEGDHPEHRSPYAELGAAVLAPRRPLARHLQLAASSQGPEPLEVIVVDRRPESGTRGAVAGASISGVPASMQDRHLLEHLGARLVVPLVTKGCVLGFIVLGEKLSEEPYSAEDRELLGTVAEQTAIALDYSTLIEHVAERERLEREIQIASEVQSRLLPAKGPQLDGLGYEASCRPARGVGGDFYDFLGVGPGRLGIGIGDVAGKGISAALLMASLQALLRSHAPSHNHDLAHLVHELNRHLCETTDAARFATFFFGVYDESARRMDYVNAGHVPPMVLREAANGERRVERLASSGTPLGLFDDVSWEQRSVDLDRGDWLFLFSDGLTEAAGPGDDLFGEERLIDLVRTTDPAFGERAALDRILDSVTRFTGPAGQSDDVTLVAARVR